MITRDHYILCCAQQEEMGTQECYQLKISKLVGVQVFFLAGFLRLLNGYEAMHHSLLMSFVRAFFNRLVTLWVLSLRIFIVRQAAYP